MTPFEAHKSVRLSTLTDRKFNQDALDIYVKTKDDFNVDDIIAEVFEDAANYWGKIQGDRMLGILTLGAKFSLGHSIVKRDGKLVLVNLEEKILKIIE